MDTKAHPSPVNAPPTPFQPTTKESEYFNLFKMIVNPNFSIETKRRYFLPSNLATK